LPLANQSVDLVFSIAVLEHLKEPFKAIQEIHRVLKKSGEVYIEIPFIQPFHESPNDYYRATLQGLKHWCRNFTEIESGVCVGPGSAIAWMEIEYVRLLFGKIPIIGLILELLFRAWSLPLKYLDKLIINYSESHKTASAIFFYGRKQ
jgi:ubiquinone/menaquinone biosynthesis C-methylase UbiE